jgi:hypothetical protein
VWLGRNEDGMKRMKIRRKTVKEMWPWMRIVMMNRSFTVFAFEALELEDACLA